LTDITDRNAGARVSPLPLSAGPDLTPTGVQSARVLTARRIFVTALNLVTLFLLGWGVASVLGSGGWSTADVIIFAAFLFGAPWTVMGMWNAVIGVALLHLARDPLKAVAPHMTTADQTAPITARTAVCMTLRNEPPARALTRLAAIRASLDATGWGGAYDFFVLSDTNDPEVAAEEERLFAEMRARLGGARATYRRREINTGYKAGNVRDFLRNQGSAYDFFLPLDSDSLMSGGAIVAMTRVMQAHPRLGLLQSLVVGAPSGSAFARVFQFGMRHGMRSFTMGAAWWHGDCGPYWGHNALVRVRPFRRHCRLPVLPGEPPLGGHILSHDQLEAVLLRRAGYEVRVIPFESESFEDNPPTLMDFTRRDLRWCQGNMQYWRFLAAPGLKPMSRFQVFSAIMMYLGAPAWMAMIAACLTKVWADDRTGIDGGFAIVMFFTMVMVSLVPKLMGMLDVALTTGGLKRYGGAVRFAICGVLETLFSILLAPVVAFRVSLFLIGLLFGRTVRWNGQNRDAYALSLGDAARGLWMQTAFGATILSVALVATPAAALWTLPVSGALILAIPFALFTASPAVGRAMARVGLFATPEELAPTPELLALDAAPSEAEPPRDRAA
jgi:membrane glycosyltransferase